MTTCIDENDEPEADCDRSEGAYARIDNRGSDDENEEEGADELDDVFFHTGWIVPSLPRQEQALLLRGCFFFGLNS